MPKLGMNHPQVAAVFQASMDAEITRSAGRTLEDTLLQIIDRLKYLFGDDVPVRRIERAVRQAWAATDSREAGV